MRADELTKEPEAPEAPEGKGRVKKAILGDQGPDSEPGPTLPDQRVSGDLILGGRDDVASSIAMDRQYWPVPRSELARPWRLLATSTVYSPPVVLVMGLPRTAINASLAAHSPSPCNLGSASEAHARMSPAWLRRLPVMSRQCQPAHPQSRADCRAQPTWDPLDAGEPTCDLAMLA